MKKGLVIVLSMLVTMVFGVQACFAEESGKLPNIKILATGGTIAGSAPTSTQLSGYQAGVIGIQTLIDAVPQMKDYANVSGEQVCKISSNNITDAIWLQIANRVNELVADKKVDGIVITHGTDTLEETAYFLNLVVKSNKPVVLVGSMRPATAISADGPLNLLNAVRLAGSKAAWGKGVLVTLNDEINGAREVTKTNTTHVSTFKTPELGSLGYISDGKIAFYRDVVRKHTANSEFAGKKIDSLPYVEVIYGRAGDSRILIDAAVAAGAKGIVYAGTGDGSIHQAAEAGLVDAQKKGVVIVRSSRVGSGVVSDGTARYREEYFLRSDNLLPHKARILLAVALTQTKDLVQIQRMFNEY